jgi:quinohemoprotein ethanol dehydrogenase
MAVLIAAILVVSSLVAFTLPVKHAEAQQQLPREQRNWEYVNKDAAASNYNPQTQINKGNVQFLELKWMYPFPDAGIYTKNQIGVSLLQGTDVPPLIVDGIVYLADNNKNIYAINAETGKTVWINEYKVNMPELAKTLRIRPTAGSHIHAINYVNGWILVNGLACQIRAVDALTGKDAWTIKDMCLNVPGDHPDSLWAPLGSHPPSLYKNILVTDMSGGDGNNGGRTFIAGYDISTTPPKLVWRFFQTPPTEGDRDWALRECSKGWFFSEVAWKKEGKLGLSCEEVRRACERCLLNDWGVPKFSGLPWAGQVSHVWGQIAVDEETGIIYLGTGNANPRPNLTQWMGSGPLLYAATVLALDAQTGKLVWYFQTQPRGAFSSDCAWSTMLIKARIDGQERKVIKKGCKTGATMFFLDAATGKPCMAAS